MYDPGHTFLERLQAKGTWRTGTEAAEMLGWLSLFVLFWLDLLLSHNQQLTYPYAFWIFGWATWGLLFLGQLKSVRALYSAGAVGQVGLCLAQQLGVYLRTGAFDIAAFLALTGLSLLCLRGLKPE